MSEALATIVSCRSSVPRRTGCPYSRQGPQFDLWEQTPQLTRDMIAGHPISRQSGTAACPRCRFPLMRRLLHFYAMLSVNV